MMDAVTIESARIPLALALAFASIFSLQFSMWKKRATSFRTIFYAVLFAGVIGSVLLKGIYSVASMELAVYSAGFLLYFANGNKKTALLYFASQALATAMIILGVVIPGFTPLVFIGFLLKLGAFPLHLWFRSALENSTIGTAAIISASLSTSILFTMISNSIVSESFIAIGLIGAFAGAILALGSKRTREKTAYIAMAGTGLALIPIGFGGDLFGIAIAFIFSLLFAKQALFILAGLVEEKASSNFGINSAALLAASFSIAGLPLTAGFISLHELLFHAAKLELFNFFGILLAALLLVFYACLSSYKQLAESEGQGNARGIESMLALSTISMIALGLVFWVIL